MKNDLTTSLARMYLAQKQTKIERLITELEGVQKERDALRQEVLELKDHHRTMTVLLSSATFLIIMLITWIVRHG